VPRNLRVKGELEIERGGPKKKGTRVREEVGKDLDHWTSGEAL